MKRLSVLTLFALAVLIVAGFKIGGNANPAIASTQRSVVLLSSRTTSPAPATHPWQTRMLVLKVCENYGVNMFGNNGAYCMHMEVPIKYNGQRVQVTAVPMNQTWWDSAPGTPRPWAGALCFASPLPVSDNPNSPIGEAGPDQLTSDWCGLRDSPWQGGWQLPGRVPSGASFPALQENLTGPGQQLKTWQLVFTQPCGNGGIPCLQQIVPPGPVSKLYLGMNVESDEPFNTPDPTNWIFGYPTVTTYPWMRGVIYANGTMSCTTQADPIAKWIGPNADPTRGSCPPGSVWGSNPVTLGPKPSPPKPTPPPSANPPAAAIAAWKATASDASNTVGAAFKGVANLLPASDAAQIAELNQLATIPLGGGLSEDPPAQAAEGQADITALDNFFGTPGLNPGTGSDTGTSSSTPPPSSTAPPSAGPGPAPTPAPPANALAAWQATANDPAATLSTALTQVASDLTSSDATQIAQLNQLASLPPTGDTPAQTAEGQADVTALDQFFNTPGFQP